MREVVAQQLALHVEVGADNRLDADAMRAAVEFDQPAQVGEVSNGKGRHAKRGRLFYQRPRFCQSINHGIVTVHSQVHKTRFSHFCFRLTLFRR
ncbi:hypothetical protein BN128_1691 [Cronobacter sakazakii 696]|nr:hypothetical protein BN128_1691 [Cronobacter sakazakii 696]